MGTRKILAFALLASCLGAPAQELKLEDAGSSASPLTAKSISDAPLDPALRLVLTQAIVNREYTRAESILLEEINKNPRSSQLLALVAGVFFLDGKYLNTAIAMKRAEAITPLDNSSRFTLALSYIILDHRDWARPELERLAKSNAREPRYPYWLGRIQYDSRQYAGAVAHFQKALELKPDFIQGYDNLGLSYEGLGKYDLAIENYRQAIELNRLKPPSSPWPPLNLASLLVKMGRLEEGRSYIQESLRYDPRFARAHYQMGLVLEKEKKDQEAIRELQQAVASDAAFPEPYYHLAKIYQRTGDQERAKAAWGDFQKLKSEKKDERAR